MSQPRQEIIADGLRFTWEAEEVAIEATRFRESSRSLQCELTVYCTNPALEHASLLHWGHLNLYAPRSQADLAKELADRWRVGQNSIDDARFAWKNMILQLAVKVVQYMRQEDPILDLDGQAEPSENTFLLYPFLPTGDPTILYGDGGSGKSYLAMAFGITVHRGWTDNPLDVEVSPDPAPVLYLDWELEHERQNERLTALRKGFRLEPFKLPWLRCVSPLADNVARLQREIRDHGIRLLIVDSLFGACGGELKETEEPSRFFRALRSLKTSSLVVAHSPKPDKDGKTSGIYGSIFFRNMARAVFETRGEQEPGSNTLDMTVMHRKWNYTQEFGDRGYGLTFSRDETLVETRDLVPKAFSMRERTVADQIVDVLLARGKMKLGELAEAIGKRQAHVASELTALKKSDRVVNFNGYWGAVAEPEQLF